MKKILYLILLFASFKVNAEDIYEGMVIKKITINIQKEEKIPSLKTQEGSKFSQFLFDEDLKKLSEEYSQVLPYLKVKDNKLYIHINLFTKPLIHDIKIKGNTIFKDKKLFKELNVKKGDVFDKNKFQKGLTNIKDLYIKKRYFEPEISYDISEIDPNTINLCIQIKEGSSTVIQSIIFKGFTNKEVRDIKALMFTKKHNFLFSWLTKQGIYKPEAMDQDYINIINYLNDQGYADATVKINFEKTENKKLLIEIIANKGPIYKIGNVSFSGNTIFSDKQVKNTILIHKGDIFSPTRIHETIHSIKTLYGKDGYVETQVTQNLLLQETKNVYNVHFDIFEGNQFKIGLIHIIGNKQTKPNVILRESLLTPGEVFDSRKLEATQRRLESIGYFKDVKVYTVYPKDIISKKENYKDVYIEVEETTTGSGNISAQISQQNALAFSLELTERNFNIQGFKGLFTKEKFTLRGAGEYAHAKATIGKKQRNYLISWVDPYFRDSLWRFGFELNKTFSELQTKNYKVYTYGGSVFTSYPITNLWTTGIKYRIRHSDTKLNSAAKRKINEADQLKKLPNPTEDQQKEIDEAEKDQEIDDNDGLICAMGFTLNYDSTNSAYKPNRGIRSSFLTEVAGIGGDFYFLKFTYQNSLYIPIWSRGTLKFVGNIKFLNPFGKTDVHDLPYSERFFLGGETSVRGYKPYCLGPHKTKNDRDPLGGISSLLLSAEYSQEIVPRVDLFGFFDGGSISLKYYRVKKINTSVGFGLRIEIMPRAPVAIGYGFALNPDRKQDKQKFFYSFGAQF